MLVNPSIYNTTGRLNFNYDPFNDRRSTASKFNVGANRYDKSLASSINQAMNSAVSNFSKQFNESLKGLNKAANVLSDPKGEAFQSRSASSSSKAFTVTAAAGATMGTSTFAVSQMATHQKNASKAFSSTSLAHSGSSFDLKIDKGSKSTALSFKVEDGETTGTALNRFAKSINSSGIGVTARVNVDEQGYAKLNIVSNETGKDNGFKLSGTLADAFSLNDQQEEGKDLAYERDGVKGTSSSNTLTLDNGKVTVKVQGTTEDPAKFTVKEDPNGMTNAVKAFATAYNQFVDSTKDNTNPMVKSMATQFKNSIAKSLTSMNLEGIGLDKNGKMAINEKELSNAIEANQDSVKKAVVKFDSFANAIERKTENVLNSPISKYLPQMESRPTAVKPFMYNYDKSSSLNNLNTFNTQGSIIDITL